MKKAKKDILEDDALKNDQMKLLWDKYGLFVIIFVALSITTAVCFETFKSWVNQKNQEVSNAFAVALSLQNQGKTEDSLKLLQTLSTKSGIYSDIARMQMVNIYFEQKDDDKAVEQLNFLISDGNVKEQIKEIAILKLATHKLDQNAPSSEIEKLLAPLAEKENAGYNVARELLAMLSIRDENLEEAKNEYERISASANSSDLMKSRALDMINIIDGKTTK